MSKTSKSQGVSILRQSQDTARRATEQRTVTAPGHYPPLILCKIVSYDGIRAGVQTYTVRPLIGRQKTESTATIPGVFVSDETASPLAVDAIVEVLNVRGQMKRIISGAGGGSSGTIQCEPQQGLILKE